MNSKALNAVSTKYTETVTQDFKTKNDNRINAVGFVNEP